MLNNNNYKDEKNTQTAQFFELPNYNKRGAYFATPATLARPKNYAQILQMNIDNIRN